MGYINYKYKVVLIVYILFYNYVMTLAGTLFLELWKRYSAEIAHHWGLSGFDPQAEHPRPEYLARLRDAKTKKNFVTQTVEPYVPFWKVRVPATILSFSVVLLLVIILNTTILWCKLGNRHLLHSYKAKTVVDYNSLTVISSICYEA